MSPGCAGQSSWTMTWRQAMLIKLGLAVVIYLLLASVALAWTGRDPVLTIEPIRSCKFGQVTARLRPDGGVLYDAYGQCGDKPVNGQMAFSPDGRFNETFRVLGAQVVSKGTCSSDPWTTAAQCSNQLVSARGANVNYLPLHSAPLSLRVPGAVAVFRAALRNASRPQPPAMPASLQARSRGVYRSVDLTWYAPDESGDRPFTHFVIEIRPHAAEGARWKQMTQVARHGDIVYRATIKLPENIPGSSGWDVRACAATALAVTYAVARDGNLLWYRQGRVSLEEYRI